MTTSSSEQSLNTSILRSNPKRLPQPFFSSVLCVLFHVLATHWTAAQTVLPCCGDWELRSVSPSPTQRQHHSMAYDSTRGRTVVYGGDSPQLLGDTWEWDGTNWTGPTTTGPSARNESAMAYD